MLFGAEGTTLRVGDVKSFMNDRRFISAELFLEFCSHCICPCYRVLHFTIPISKLSLDPLTFCVSEYVCNFICERIPIWHAAYSCEDNQSAIVPGGVAIFRSVFGWIVWSVRMRRKERGVYQICGGPGSLTELPFSTLPIIPWVAVRNSSIEQNPLLGLQTNR